MHSHHRGPLSVLLIGLAALPRRLEDVYLSIIADDAERGTWSQEPGFRSQESGTRSQELNLSASDTLTKG